MNRPRQQQQQDGVQLQRTNNRFGTIVQVMPPSITPRITGISRARHSPPCPRPPQSLLLRGVPKTISHHLIIDRLKSSRSSTTKHRCQRLRTAHYLVARLSRAIRRQMDSVHAPRFHAFIFAVIAHSPTAPLARGSHVEYSWRRATRPVRSGR